MKLKHTSVIIFMAFAISGLATGRHLHSLDSISGEIRVLSARLVSAIAKGDIASILSHYGDQFHFLPQFRLAISDKAILKKFYSEWLGSIEIDGYRRKIMSIEVIGDRAVEIGGFEMRFRDEGTKERTYRGNYMVIWKIDNNRYMIEAESFVSDSYLSVDGIPHRDVGIQKPPPTVELASYGKLGKEVLELNHEVIENVETGNGQGRASGFHRDAIYMPNFRDKLVGIEEIRPYLLEIYYPGSNFFVEHSFYKIAEIDENHILVVGHFKGGWDRPNDKGLFEGNMLNLRKRNDDGKPVIYRQLTNSDR